ncbi:P-loop containing nucleoside triphosphate hydrolase protein [Xylariales sp. AK1849]|nr:P-loop containing nucleoside triphosphate hydrolase protein [Xylariales sp. AK1849]
MDQIKRNESTAEQVRKLQDGAINPLTKKPYSDAYRVILKQRRGLPVTSKHQQFLDVYQSSSVTVLSSDTGSGKTTQVPAFVLFDEWKSGKKIACTQPRRLAATEVAKRVADELDVTLGNEVGYATRFDSKVAHNTRIVYLTDGFLLRVAGRDPDLTAYACVIIDEAHERTNATDTVMALLKGIVARRDNFKVIIMSATMDSAKFQAYFNDAPLFHIPGRQQRVDIFYATGATPNTDYFRSAVRIVKHIHETKGNGDILLFLSDEDEIKRACVDIMSNTKHLDALPLYAAPSAAEKDRVLAKAVAGRQKCTVSTNIAETSLTIDGIVYVIDCGFVKRLVYNPRARLDILQLAPISKAAAVQRAGRAGRTQAGQCFRMYTKEMFDQFMRPSPQPGMLSTELKSVILGLKAAGFHDMVNFDWIDKPAPEVVARALEELHDLRLVQDDQKLTTLGRIAETCPIDPNWVVVIEESKALRCMNEIVTLAAIASSQHPIFLRPYAHRYVADAARAQFGHPKSDHITQLNAFLAFMRTKLETVIPPEQWCKDHFLSFRVLEEVEQTRAQLKRHFDPREIFGSNAFSHPDYSTNILKALALGLFNQSAIKMSGDEYRTVHDNQPALLHAESALVGAPDKWVVYNTFTKPGAKHFIQTVSAIEPEWIMHLPYFQDARLPKKANTMIFRQIAVKEFLDKARAKVEKAG